MRCRWPRPGGTLLSGEAYCMGRGTMALGLAKVLQKYEKQSMHLVDKATDPPLAVPASMADRMTDLTPGAKNVFKGTGEDKPYPLIEVNLQALQHMEAKIAKTEERIAKVFFNDLFLLFTTAGARDITATEILKA